jgi:type IV fimbrial biogenesis protein FimT
VALKVNIKSLKVKNRGFTLIELMIVVVILGVLATLGGPSLMSFMPKYKVDNAAKELTTEIQLLRMQAISENVRVRMRVIHTPTSPQPQTIERHEINFDGTVILNDLGDITFGKPGTNYPNIAIGRSETTIDLPDGNNLASGNDGKKAALFNNGNEIIFYSNGLTNTSGEFYIVPVQHDTDLTVDQDHIRALQIMKAGMIRRFRFDPTPGFVAWKEF